MFLQEEEKNIITGILGTIAVHLILLIVFLVARIDKVKNIHQEPIVIEFDEEVYKTLQEMQEEKELESQMEEQLQEDLKNIAVNAASEMKEDISTEKYIEELKEELDIEDLYQDLDRSIGEEPVIEPEKQKDKPKEKKEYHGPTRIEYNLGGRGHRYIHRPIYKCKGNGSVTVAIVVNPAGDVINATVIKANTKEICISETALESARRSKFEIKLDADPRQKGTITYTFVAQ